ARAWGLHGLHAFQSAFCPVAGVPCVQTVHELSWKHGVRETGAWKQKLWVALGRRRAAGVMCATDFAARDYGGGATVIPWGLEPYFQPEVPSGDAQALKARGLLDVPYLLAPGGLRAKKRPLDLMQALAETASHGGHLVFTGSHSPGDDDVLRLASQLGIQDRVHHFSQVRDRELAVLYRHARASLAIAWSEGFCLPVIESLASGTRPIVAADSAQAEVAAGHAWAVTRGDRAGLIEAMEHALSTDARASESAMEHARSFTWDRTARGIEELWEALL
ncbi:MAG: glycosyltransferase, partial [Planctomycetes bacterium]|nr:glycosyltransferase [Planctomycetota bacterium]